MTCSISCIIPTFNRGLVLCDTVEMLLNQTVPPLEIILIDQSTDVDNASISRLSRWEAEGSIQRHHQPEPNASKARNRGAQVSQGEVLLFLDDDIQIDSDFVAAHARNYLDDEVKAVAGQILELNEDVVYSRNRKSDDPEIDWMYFPRNYGRRCWTTWMASGNFSIRRTVFFEIGGMDENYMRGAYREESDFALRFLRKGYRFQFDPQASIYHLAIAGAPVGGTRQSGWTKYWFHMFGFWYFVIKYATWTTWPTHLLQGVRYFLFNSYTLRHPWRIPILAAQFAATCPMAIATRWQGSKTLFTGHNSEVSSNCISQ